MILRFVPGSGPDRGLESYPDRSGMLLFQESSLKS